MRLVLSTYSHSVSVSFLTLVRKDGVVATLSFSGSRFSFQRVLVSLKQSTSPDSTFQNFHLPFYPISQRTCSSTSAIPPISENRRRLMEYTHKDTCNNQTLPHPTTPLGTLTHKTPPQHPLAGNS